MFGAVGVPELLMMIPFVILSLAPWLIAIWAMVVLLRIWKTQDAIVLHLPAADAARCPDGA